MSDDKDSPQEESRMPFGAGLKRRRIEFVRAGTDTAAAQNISHSTFSAGDRYLSIVFKNGGSAKALNTTGTTLISQSSESPTEQTIVAEGTWCEICKLPMSAQGDETATSTTPHEASIAHMVCMAHSHPPSHLDRNRRGLRYLSSYGWDPDSRTGLGAAGDGIRAPIKARVKHDTVGLGVKLEASKNVQQEKTRSLDAKQARKRDLEDRKKRERLQELFYRDDYLEKYLGATFYADCQVGTIPIHDRENHKIA